MKNNKNQKNRNQCSYCKLAKIPYEYDKELDCYCVYGQSRIVDFSPSFHNKSSNQLVKFCYSDTPHHQIDTEPLNVKNIDFNIKDTGASSMTLTFYNENNFSSEVERKVVPYLTSGEHDEEIHFVVQTFNGEILESVYLIFPTDILVANEKIVVKYNTSYVCTPCVPCGSTILIKNRKEKKYA